MTDDLTKPLAFSTVGCLMNKVKLSLVCAKKNAKLATKLADTINLLSEQLLPNFIS